MIYLLHFDKPFRHARHYLGHTNMPLEKRLAAHAGDERCGRSAKLMTAVRKAGITWRLVRTWEGDRERERRLKKRTGVQHCPVCRDERAVDRAVAMLTLGG